jgi:hypothetical protein
MLSSKSTYQRAYMMICFGIFSSLVFAQEKEKPTQTAVMELAKATQNPVADMVTIPFQFNWYTGGGFGNQTMSQYLFQPVLPLSISKDWNLISRTIAPIMNIPQDSGSRLKGIGDIQEEIFFSPKEAKKVVWGIGPVFSFPTATINAIATGQFAIGPTGVILLMPGKWVIGAVANNLWRFAGSESTTAISFFFIQPFINYNFKGGWALSTSPSITANWSAKSGQKWTVPVGLGVSKITHIGGQPLSIGMQYYHNVVHPDNAGADQVRISVSLLFPRKK